MSKSGGLYARNRGFNYEREVVTYLRRHGHGAERMWGSDGRSRGLPKEVDLQWTMPYNSIVNVQCKRTKAIAKYLKPTHGVDMVFVREDRGKTHVILTLDKLLELLDK